MRRSNIRGREVNYGVGNQSGDLSVYRLIRTLQGIMGALSVCLFNPDAGHLADPDLNKGVIVLYLRMTFGDVLPGFSLIMPEPLLARNGKLLAQSQGRFFSCLCSRRYNVFSTGVSGW